MIHPLTIPYMALVIFFIAFYYVPAVQEDLKDERIREDLKKGWIMIPLLILLFMIMEALK